MPPPKDKPNPIAAPGDEFTEHIHSDPYPAIDSSKANLSGKSVFICGASKGIGRAIAVSYAKAGASKIAIGARSDLTAVEKSLGEAATAAGKNPPKVLQVNIEVTKYDSVSSAAQEIEKAFGNLDIVVHNAGVIGAMAPVADTDPDAWWNIWEVNIRGPYLVTKEFLPLLLKGGDKQIVYTTSVGAWLVMPGLSSYQSSKLALSRFSEFVAKEYSEQGVVAWSIHPGNVMTDIFGPEGPAESVKHIFTETPELCGDSVVFLTAEKRAWLSGRYISATWNMPELMAKKDEIVEGDKLKARMAL